MPKSKARGKRAAAKRPAPGRKTTPRRGGDRAVLTAAFGSMRQQGTGASGTAAVVAVSDGAERGNAKNAQVGRSGGGRQSGRMATPLKPAGRLTRMLAAAGSSHRLKLLAALATGGPTGVDAGVLRKAARLTGGPLYHHINQLRLAGLVKNRRRDTYELTSAGRRFVAILAAAQPLIR